MANLTFTTPGFLFLLPWYHEISTMPFTKQFIVNTGAKITSMGFGTTAGPNVQEILSVCGLFCAFYVLSPITMLNHENMLCSVQYTISSFMTVVAKCRL